MLARFGNVEWATRGKVSFPNWIQRRSKSMCVNVAWNLPLVVGNISTSAGRMAAWYGAGSRKVNVEHRGMIGTPDEFRAPAWLSVTVEGAIDLSAKVGS
jgi:hypothetical protein